MERRISAHTQFSAQTVGCSWGGQYSLEEDVFVGMTILRAASKMPFSGSTGVGRAAFRASRAQKSYKQDDLIKKKKKRIVGA